MGQVLLGTVCAVGLSEPLPYYSLFMANYRAQLLGKCHCDFKNEFNASRLLTIKTTAGTILTANLPSFKSLLTRTFLSQNPENVQPHSSNSTKNVFVCSNKGLMLETSAKHHILQATNIPYQPLWIKPIFSVLVHTEKQFFFKTSLQ